MIINKPGNLYVRRGMEQTIEERLCMRPREASQDKELIGERERVP